jgi:hypothetical protein
MRVAVRHPGRTEEDGTTVPESFSAYRVGRIDDHVDLLTGETTSADEVAEILVEQAKAEYPDCEVAIQRLIDNGDGTSKWVNAEEVPEGATSPDGVVVKAPELVIEQSQDAAPETAMTPQVEQQIGGV